MKKISLLLIAALLSTAMCAQTDKTDEVVDQYGVKVEVNPVQTTERDGILVFENNKGYKFWFDTRIQADFGTFWGEPDYADEIGSGANIRRARFAAKANITPDWYGEIDMEIANGSFELKDAIIRYTGFKNFELTVGNFKQNFSISRNTTSRYLEFIERPMVVSALAPSRFLGVGAKYNNSLIWASAGIFFQEIEGQETRTYVEDNNKDYGYNEGLTYTAKVVLRPINKLDYGIHIGVAGSYINPKTSNEVYGTTRFSTRNTTSINRKKYLDTDDLKYTDHNLLGTIEIAGHYNGLRVESAVISDKVIIEKDKESTYNGEKDLTFSGWYAQAGYLLFGGKQSYDSDGAKFNRIRPAKSWGDLEVCARYEFLNLNDFDALVYGGAGEVYTLGLNLFLGKNFKFMVNYQYANNDRYANGKGKLFIGEDALGQPTKDYTKVVAEDGKAGVDYHMLICRFQIAF